MISVVIPAFDEAESIVQLYAELTRVASDHKYDLQVIFVDDGSKDET